MTLWVYQQVYAHYLGTIDPGKAACISINAESQGLVDQDNLFECAQTFAQNLFKRTSSDIESASLPTDDWAWYRFVFDAIFFHQCVNQLLRLQGCIKTEEDSLKGMVIEEQDMSVSKGIQVFLDFIRENRKLLSTLFKTWDTLPFLVQCMEPAHVALMDRACAIDTKKFIWPMYGASSGESPLFLNQITNGLREYYGIRSSTLERRTRYTPFFAKVLPVTL